MSMGSAAGGAGDGPGAKVTSMSKAKLNVYKPIVPPPGGTETAPHTGGAKAEKVYDFDYNPKEITFENEAKVQEVTTGHGTGNPQQQVVGAKSNVQTFELYYSRFEPKKLIEYKLPVNDLDALKDELLALTRPHPSTVGPNKTPSPPLVDVSWGNLVTEPCLVKKVTVTYTHMLPNGDPMRMKATVELLGAAFEKRKTNPSSGGRTNRKTHTLLAGETLASVAYAEFNDAALWRTIAEENEIDDPMRLTAGAVLLLPTFEE
jgi:nucleoid-associated protein YgaU